MNKKGNFGPIILGITGFLVLIILLSVGATFLTSLRDAQSKTLSAFQNDSNKNLSNMTAVTLTYSNILDILVYNISDGKIIQKEGNYTWYSNGTIIYNKTTGVGFPNQTFYDIHYNYSYSTKPISYNITQQGNDSIKTISDYQSTIAIILIVVFLVGLLIIYLYNKIKG